MSVCCGQVVEGPQTLYRCYDRGDYLLYVGVTCDRQIRFRAHARSNWHWWGKVARIELEWYHDREEAVIAERHAIATEHPHYNIQGRRFEWAG